MSSPSSLAFRAIIGSGRSASFEPLIFPAASGDGSLRLNVLFTSAAETLGALRSAGALTAGMPAEVLLLVPLIVPFPLSLEEPPTPMSFVCRRIGELLRGLPDGVSVEACVLPCRNPAETILNVLKPRSLVLIGARRHDLFARPWRLARKLRRAGHEVLIAGPA